MIRRDEVEFFLRLHGLWEGIIALPPPPRPPFDIKKRRGIGGGLPGVPRTRRTNQTWSRSTCRRNGGGVTRLSRRQRTGGGGMISNGTALARQRAKSAKPDRRGRRRRHSRPNSSSTIGRSSFSMPKIRFPPTSGRSIRRIEPGQDSDWTAYRPNFRTKSSRTRRGVFSRRRILGRSASEPRENLTNA